MAINTLTPLFRGPDGNLIPLSVDSDGRLQASIYPFADPTNAFNFVDAPPENVLAKISFPGTVGLRRVITLINASMAQRTANSDQYHINLTGSISGLLWRAEMGLVLNTSQTVGFSNGFIYSELGEDLTLEFVPTTAPVANTTQTLVLGGFSVAA